MDVEKKLVISTLKYLEKRITQAMKLASDWPLSRKKVKAAREAALEILERIDCDLAQLKGEERKLTRCERYTLLTIGAASRDAY